MKGKSDVRVVISGLFCRSVSPCAVSCFSPLFNLDLFFLLIGSFSFVSTDSNQRSPFSLAFSCVSFILDILSFF